MQEGDFRLDSDVLRGVRLLDFSLRLPGPHCTALLAALGADVVRVEPPRGDPMRAVPEAFGHLARGVRSLVLNLAHAPAREIARKLATRADVLVEGFRSGTMEKRGLGYESLRELNPGLIYCSLTGFGSGDPRSARPGHDLTFAAASGLLSMQTKTGGVPPPPAVFVADVAASLSAAVAVLAALYERGRTGAGRKIDVAIVSSAVDFVSILQKRPPALPVDGSFARYRCYRCKDGRHLAVAAVEDLFWRSFCEVIGRPDLSAAGLERNRARRRATAGAVAARLRQKTRRAWLSRIGDRQICVEPVLPFQALGPEHPIAHFIRNPPRRVPAAGEDALSILSEAGFGPEETTRLLQSPALGGHDRRPPKLF